MASFNALASTISWKAYGGENQTPLRLVNARFAFEIFVALEQRRHYRLKNSLLQVFVVKAGIFESVPGGDPLAVIMTSYGVVESRDASEQCFQPQCTGYRYDSKSMANFVVDCIWIGRDG
jgi:hypothetical protein